MALSTVSSLDESFTSGIPFVSEDPPVVSVEKDKEALGTPTGPSENTPEDKTEQIPSKDDSRDVTMNETPEHEKPAEPQNVQPEISVKQPRGGGEQEGGESDSGSEEEDAILEVHD